MSIIKRCLLIIVVIFCVLLCRRAYIFNDWSKNSNMSEYDTRVDTIKNHEVGKKILIGENEIIRIELKIYSELDEYLNELPEDISIQNKLEELEENEVYVIGSVLLDKEHYNPNSEYEMHLFKGNGLGSEFPLLFKEYAMTDEDKVIRANFVSFESWDNLNEVFSCAWVDFYQDSSKIFSAELQCFTD